MPFWTTQKIREALASETPPIVNPKSDRVGTACYELALGGEVFVSSQNGTKQTLQERDQLKIPPGQFALLISNEEVSIPHDVIAFISIKASKKMHGLVNVSGFHVDPGFRGRLKFSVYNAGPEAIVLDVGAPLFPIWFASLTSRDANPYNGRHQGQAWLNADDVARLQGELASPAALKARVDALDASVTNWKYVTGTALTAAIATALVAVAALLMQVIGAGAGAPQASGCGNVSSGPDAAVDIERGERSLVDATIPAGDAR
jgi:dCTP deaminase